MQYLNFDSLAELSHNRFEKQAPYPWATIHKTLTDVAFRDLCGNMPDVSLFTRDEGVPRACGQASHDRYSLHYWPGLRLPKPWREFLEELQGDDYQSFLRRVLEFHSLLLTFEWHYAWQGCSVSPHCDAARKIATHLFYFNVEEDWDPSWGGQTLILADDDRRFRTHSAPHFDQLRVAASSQPSGNNSLLFQRTPHSWHGVRPLTCPMGKTRRLFKVTVNTVTFQVWWRKLRGKDADGYRATA